MLNLVLPFPPSVNEYWKPIPTRGRGGRVVGARMILTKAAREYKRHVHSILGDNVPMKELVAMTMTYESPKVVRTRDADNYNKALWDALTLCGIWEDDSQVDEYHVYRGKPGNNRVLVTIQEINR